MLDEARRRLAPFGDRVTFVTADLLEPLPLAAPVDAILSTATFHWIRDHDALFANLAAVLRPGGQLVAQCGGAGNLASVAQALRELGADPFGAKVYATPEETEPRLRSAGFTDIECWLHREPTPFGSADELHTYLATVALGDHIEPMSEDEARGVRRRRRRSRAEARDGLRPAEHPRAQGVSSAPQMKSWIALSFISSSAVAAPIGSSRPSIRSSVLMPIRSIVIWHGIRRTPMS